MRLLGKYAFDKLRDCFQGVFEFYKTGADSELYYILELWQIRFTILPNQYIELSINQGPNKPYKTIGKVTLSN